MVIVMRTLLFECSFKMFFIKYNINLSNKENSCQLLKAIKHNLRSKGYSMYQKELTLPNLSLNRVSIGDGGALRDLVDLLSKKEFTMSELETI